MKLRCCLRTATGRSRARSRGARVISRSGTILGRSLPIFSRSSAGVSRSRLRNDPSARSVLPPAGSTAYNLSVQGPIIPIGAPLLALTPISPFRPRRWHGALLPDSAVVTIEVLEADKRPVAAVADHDEVRFVQTVETRMQHEVAMRMLFDPGHNLDERILREQFGV